MAEHEPARGGRSPEQSALCDPARCRRKGRYRGNGGQPMIRASPMPSPPGPGDVESEVHLLRHNGDASDDLGRPCGPRRCWTTAPVATSQRTCHRLAPAPSAPEPLAPTLVVLLCEARG